jgi:hypothetical protein
MKMRVLAFTVMFAACISSAPPPPAQAAPTPAPAPAQAPQRADIQCKLSTGEAATGSWDKEGKPTFAPTAQAFAECVMYSVGHRP